MSWNRKSIESRLSDYSEPSSEIVLRENLVLKAELADLKAQLEISKNITSEIETKMAAAESEVYKVYKETKNWKEALAKKDDEIVALKNSLKKSADEKQQTNAELLKMKKMMKAKDKEIHNLENYIVNHPETAKTL